jgi:hypothetical protein
MQKLDIKQSSVPKGIDLFEPMDPSRVFEVFQKLIQKLKFLLLRAEILTIV